MYFYAHDCSSHLPPLDAADASDTIDTDLDSIQKTSNKIQISQFSDSNFLPNFEDLMSKTLFWKKSYLKKYHFLQKIQEETVTETILFRYISSSEVSDVSK